MARKAKEGSLIERGTTDVFHDLGLEHADQLLAKSKLARAIIAAIKESKISQSELGRLAGIDQPKISQIVHGRISGFSSDRLLRILNSLDRDVEIIIRPKPKSEQRQAHVSVAVMHSL